MASDPPQAAVSGYPPAGASPVRDKVRIRFRKGEDLRLLSHHDLMRAFQRILRRADLPVRQTKGFNPHPRLVFALSLPLGVIGCEEVVELELNEVLPLDELQSSLVRQTPPGLDLLEIKRIGPRDGAQVRRLTYRLWVPADRVADLPDRISDVLARSECVVERTRPPVRRVDLRPFLSDLRLVHHFPINLPREGLYSLYMELNLTPQGTARPEEVLALLGLQDLVEAGAVLERSRLELQDEFAACGEAPPGASPQAANIHPSTAEGFA
jgi:radical SAM-linked protein